VKLERLPHFDIADLLSAREAGSYLLRGSFLQLKSNAAGNRARDRQKLAIKIKLNTLTP
jgi:hypothetical protein